MSEFDFNTLVDKLRAAIGQYRMTFGSERQLHDQLEQIFNAMGVKFWREYQLTAKDRLDFFISPIAVEVKTRGSLHNHLRQMRRYNEHDAVNGCILICTRPVEKFMPETLAGKPVAAICVGGARL